MTARPTPARKRLRRSASEGAELQARLIAAARELFVTEGFESVSIRKLADRAGCAPMTFYLYFKSKRALLRHIWEDVFIDVLSQCDAAAAAPSDPVEKVEAYAHALTHYWLDHPDNYRVVFMHQDVVEAPSDAYYVDSGEMQLRFEALERLIDAAKASGGLRPETDSELLTQTLFAHAIGVAHSMITIPEYPWRRQALRGAGVRLLIEAARTPPQPSNTA